MQQSLINPPREEPMNFKVIKRKSQRKWIHFVKRAEFNFNHEDGLGGLWGRSISCFLHSLWGPPWLGQDCTDLGHRHEVRRGTD